MILQDMRKRIALLSLFIIVPVGFMSKFYGGPYALWVNNSLGGLFYVIFWCLLFYLFRPGSDTLIIAGSVLIITCVLEFLQLWHPPFLEKTRNTFMGRTLIGHSFTWKDFYYYIFGACLALIWLRVINRLVRNDGEFNENRNS